MHVIRSEFDFGIFAQRFGFFFFKLIDPVFGQCEAILSDDVI